MRQPLFPRGPEPGPARDHNKRLRRERPAKRLFAIPGNEHTRLHWKRESRSQRLEIVNQALRQEFRFRERLWIRDDMNRQHRDARPQIGSQSRHGFQSGARQQAIRKGHDDWQADAGPSTGQRQPGLSDGFHPDQNDRRRLKES